MNCVHEMGQRDGGDRSVCRKGCQIWLKVFTFGGGICLHRIEPGRKIGRGTGDGTIHRVRMGGWWYGGHYHYNYHVNSFIQVKVA